MGSAEVKLHSTAEIPVGMFGADPKVPVTVTLRVSLFAKRPPLLRGHIPRRRVHRHQRRLAHPGPRRTRGDALPEHTRAVHPEPAQGLRAGRRRAARTSRVE